MRTRELIPYLVAGQALAIILLVILIGVMLSYRRAVYDISATLRRQARDGHPTMRLDRRVP